MLVVALALLACKKLLKGGDAGPSPSASTSAAAAPGPLPKVVKNPRVEEVIQDIRLYCDYTDDGGFGRCQNDEIGKARAVAEKELEHEPSVVETLAALMLEDKNPRIVRAAAEVLARLRSNFIPAGLDPKQNRSAGDFVSDATARRLLEALEKVPDANVAVDSIVVLTTAQGKLAETRAVLERLPGDRDQAERARVKGLGELMTAVGLDAFADIEKLGKSSDAEEVRAAVAAPAKMLKPGVRERNQACPWLDGFLDHDDPVVARTAIASIGELCPQNMFDDITEAAERRRRARDLDDRYMNELVKLCDPQSAVAKKRGTPERSCERMFEFFKAVAEDTKLPVLPRTVALRALGNRPSDETLEFCRKMSGVFRKEKRNPPPNFDFRLAEAANQCIQITTRRLGERQ